MCESLTMEKLQMLVYYINNTKISPAMREVINQVIVTGILTGKVDMDQVAIRTADASESLDVHRFVISHWPALQGREIKSSTLYGMYCDASGQAVTATKFGLILRSLGIPMKKHCDANYYSFCEDVGDAPSDDSIAQKGSIGHDG